MANLSYATSPEWLQASKQVDSKKGFTDLPPELRNMIYALYLSSHHRVVRLFCDERLRRRAIISPTLYSKSTCISPSLARSSISNLLRTCRQIHYEVASLFYARTMFLVRIIDADLRTGPEVHRSISPRYGSFIRRISLQKTDTKAVGMKNVGAWLGSITENFCEAFSGLQRMVVTLPTMHVGSRPTEFGVYLWANEFVRLLGEDGAERKRRRFLDKTLRMIKPDGGSFPACLRLLLGDPFGEGGRNLREDVSLVRDRSRGEELQAVKTVMGREFCEALVRAKKVDKLREAGRVDAE